jgi:hypothetical protein
MEDFTPYEYITLFLVNNNIRPACLFILNEVDDIFKLKENIIKYFPKLNIFYDIDLDSIFVSLNNIDISKIKTDDDIGLILGYPTDGIKFSEIDRNQITYSSHIKIKFKNQEEISIFDVITQTSILNQIKDLMYYFENCLRDCILFNDIDEIYSEEEIIYPVDHLYKKLINNEKLNGQEYYCIHNNISNIFTDELANYKFDFTNPHHKSIVISLLLQCKYDVCEQFYGVTYNKTEPTIKMAKLRKTYSDEILKYLNIE